MGAAFEPPPVVSGRAGQRSRLARVREDLPDEVQSRSRHGADRGHGGRALAVALVRGGWVSFASLFASSPQNGGLTRTTTDSCAWPQSRTATEIAAIQASRGGGTRTPDLRFWRPPLYQLSYAPVPGSQCTPRISGSWIRSARAAQRHGDPLRGSRSRADSGRDLRLRGWRQRPSPGRRRRCRRGRGVAGDRVVERVPASQPLRD